VRLIPHVDPTCRQPLVDPHLSIPTCRRVVCPPQFTCVPAQLTGLTWGRSRVRPSCLSATIHLCPPQLAAVRRNSLMSPSCTRRRRRHRYTTLHRRTGIGGAPVPLIPLVNSHLSIPTYRQPLVGPHLSTPTCRPPPGDESFVRRNSLVFPRNSLV
jgi:hypothetical protein